jgi:hypothetical protein
MAKLVQRRRGTTAEHTIFTGAEGELTHDTDKETIVIHDGTTVGGFPLAREDLDNVNLLNRISVAELATSDGGAGQVLQTDGSGNLSFVDFDVAGSSVGGDLTGTVSNAQIGVNKVGIAELDVTDGLDGQLLTTNGSGVLSFESPSSIALGGDLSGTTSNAQILAGAVETAELATDAVTTIKITNANVTSDKLSADSVTTSKIADASVTTTKIADSNITVSKMATGSVRSVNIIDNNILTQHIADAQVTKLKIADNSVDVAKLDATDGNSGDILSTNGSGVLSFIPQLTSLAVGGGILTGTTDNAGVANSSILNAMLATGIDASKLTGAISGSVTGLGGENFTSSFTLNVSATTTSVTNCPFEPSLVLFGALGVGSNSDSGSIGGGRLASQACFNSQASQDGGGELDVVFVLKRFNSGTSLFDYISYSLTAFLSNGFTLQRDDLTTTSGFTNNQPVQYMAWS